MPLTPKMNFVAQECLLKFRQLKCEITFASITRIPVLMYRVASSFTHLLCGWCGQSFWILHEPLGLHCELNHHILVLEYQAAFLDAAFGRIHCPYGPQVILHRLCTLGTEIYVVYFQLLEGLCQNQHQGESEMSMVNTSRKAAFE